jgi:hypothetical protein
MEVLRKTTKYLTLAVALVEVRNEYFPDGSLERYSYANRHFRTANNASEIFLLMHTFVDEV